MNLWIGNNPASPGTQKGTVLNFAPDVLQPNLRLDPLGWIGSDDGPAKVSQVYRGMPLDHQGRQIGPFDPFESLL